MLGTGQLSSKMSVRTALYNVSTSKQVNDCDRLSMIPGLYQNAA